MDWRANCAAVIPCLDEAQTIGVLVEAVRQHLPTVVVVDDGSSDRTGALAEQAGAVVLRQALPSGKGVALRTGWRLARERGFAWTLMLDGDGQHSPADIPSFLLRAEETNADLIVGDRMKEVNEMPWLRRRVNRWMSRRISKAAGRLLPDSQCGFRLARLAAVEGASLVTRHFEIESEMLLAFIRTGYKVEFVPIRTIYKSGPSKIHPFSDTLRWFRWWWSS